MTDDALPTVCILAGGLGTRLGARTAKIPKPLIEVVGRPFLLHQFDLLQAAGAERVVLCVGYLGELIEREIGSHYGGLDIAYSYDSPGLDGTLGAIRRAAPLLGERFLVLYGDTYLRVDYQDVNHQWLKSGQPAIMAVLHNHGRWDRSNAVYGSGRILRYDKFSPTSDMEWIDYGLGGITTAVLGRVGPEQSDLATLYSALALDGQLQGYLASERFFEIGSAESLAATEQYLNDAAAGFDSEQDSS